MSEKNIILCRETICTYR